MNDFSGPGGYGRVYEGRGMRIAFICDPEGRISVSLSALRGVLTEQMIQFAKEDWYPGQEVEHTALLHGLVYFQLSEA